MSIPAPEDIDAFGNVPLAWLATLVVVRVILSPDPIAGCRSLGIDYSNKKGAEGMP